MTDDLVKPSPLFSAEGQAKAVATLEDDLVKPSPIAGEAVELDPELGIKASPVVEDNGTSKPVDMAKRVGVGFAGGAVASAEAAVNVTRHGADQAAKAVQYIGTGAGFGGSVRRAGDLKWRMQREVMGTSVTRKEQEQDRLKRKQEKLSREQDSVLAGVSGYLNALKEAQREEANLNPKFDEDLSSQVAETIGGIIPNVVAAASSGGATLPTYALSALQLYQDSYDSAIKEGKDPELAHVSGMLSMPLSTFEKVGDIKLGKLLRDTVNEGFKQVRKQGMKTAVKSAVAGVATGAVGEAVSEAAQTAGKQVIENEILDIKDQTGAERLGEVVKSAIVAALTGGTVAGAAGAVRVGAEALKPGEQAPKLDREVTDRGADEPMDPFGTTPIDRFIRRQTTLDQFERKLRGEEERDVQLIPERDRNVRDDYAGGQVSFNRPADPNNAAGDLGYDKPLGDLAPATETVLENDLEGFPVKLTPEEAENLNRVKRMLAQKREAQQSPVILEAQPNQEQPIIIRTPDRNVRQSTPHGMQTTQEPNPWRTVQDGQVLAHRSDPDPKLNFPFRIVYSDQAAQEVDKIDAQLNTPPTPSPVRPGAPVQAAVDTRPSVDKANQAVLDFITPNEKGQSKAEEMLRRIAAGFSSQLNEDSDTLYNELLSEIAIKAAGNSFASAEKVDHLVNSTAKRILIDRTRKLKNEKKHLGTKLPFDGDENADDAGDNFALSEVLADTAATAHEEALATDLGRRVEEIKDELPHIQQKVATARMALDDPDLSIEDIAQYLKSIRTKNVPSGEWLRQQDKQMKKVISTKLMEAGFDLPVVQKVFEALAKEEFAARQEETIDNIRDRTIERKALTPTEADELSKLRAAADAGMLPRGGKKRMVELESRQAEVKELSKEKATKEKAKKKRSMQTTMGTFGVLDPQFWMDAVDVGVQAAKSLGRAGMKFGAWSKRMVAVLGRRVNPHLPRIWAGVQAKLANQFRSLSGRMPSLPWRIMNYGAEDVLRKAGGRYATLAREVRRWEDMRAKLKGSLLSGFSRIQDRYTRKEFTAAMSEVESYMRARESSNAAVKTRAVNMWNMMSPAGRDIVEWVAQTSEATGKYAQLFDIQVLDNGHYRPMKLMGRAYFPRQFTQRFWDIVQDPEHPDNKAEFNQLVADMLANGNAKTPDEAKAMLRQGVSDTSSNSFLANAERARGTKLPDKYYDYSVNGYLDYVNRFTERAAQVDAFGQQRGEFKPDLFTELERVTTDPKLARYVRDLGKAIYNEQVTGFGANLRRTLRKVSTLAYMSGTLTPVRNFISAASSSAEMVGVWNTTKALSQVAVDAAKAVAKTGKNFSKGDLRTMTPGSVAWAQELGAVHQDMRAAWLMDLDFSRESLLDKSVRAGLYVNGISERLGRTVSAMAAKQWLKETQGIIRKDPNSYHARTRKALLQRLGYSPLQQAALLRGDPDQEARLIRDAVREKQYGYTVNQAGMLPDTEWGKFLLQFQKWGFQRARDIRRNVLQPAFGEVVDGKRTVNLMPLLRFSLLAFGAGELYNELRKWLFGKEGKVASIEEIKTTMDENSARAMELVFERLAYDLIMGGSLGIIGDQLSNLKDFTERGRFKNPMQPPSFGLVQNLIELITARVQRGATTDGFVRDIENLVADRLPLINQVKGAGVRVADAVGSDASFVENRRNYTERTFIRGLVNRFAEESGIEGKMQNRSMAVRSPHTELYDQVTEHLMRGDPQLAAATIEKTLEGLDRKERKKRIMAIESSIRSRHPLHTFGVDTDKEYKQFLSWAEDRVPGQAERVRRLVRRYDVSADALRLK
jgi:hypothetical protein